jgi:hypothetical protein
MIEKDAAFTLHANHQHSTFSMPLIKDDLPLLFTQDFYKSPLASFSSFLFIAKSSKNAINNLYTQEFRSYSNLHLIIILVKPINHKKKVSLIYGKYIK